MSQIPAPARARANPSAEDQDIYDLSDPPPQPAPPPAPAPLPQAATLAYANNRPSLAAQQLPEDLADPTRDLYVPSAMLVGGILLALASSIYYVHQSGRSSPVLLVGVMLILSAWIVFKAFVFIGLALYMAKMLKVTIGPFRLVLLKFAGLTALLEGARELVAVCTIAQGEHRVFGMGLASIVLMYVGLGYAVHYLFATDGEERRFRKAMVSTGILVDILLVVGITLVSRAVVQSVLAARAARATPAAVVAPAPAATPAPAPAAGATPASTPPGVPTSADARIKAAIAAGWPKGLLWEVRQPRGFAGERLAARARPYAAVFYAVGAPNIYVDTQVSPPELYIELPTDPKQRSRCIDATRDLRMAPGQTPPSPRPDAKYMEMVLPR